MYTVLITAVLGKLYQRERERERERERRMPVFDVVSSPPSHSYGRMQLPSRPSQLLPQSECI